MDLKLDVYDSSFTLIGILEVADSVIWTREAFDAGSFQLRSLLTESTQSLLAEENIIWLTGTDAGIIEHREMSDGEDGAYITVSGPLLNGILSRRALWGTYNLSGKPASIMSALVSECCVSPTRGSVAKRVIPTVQLGTVPSGGAVIRKQATGGTLLDTLNAIGETNLVAFEMAFNPSTCKAVFTTYYGVDRTINQSSLPHVFYSTELDDVLSSDYTYDSSDYCNAAYIGGQVDEDTAVREYVTVEGAESGMARRELFVDARDLSREIDGETLSDAEYQAVLANRGSEKLAERTITQSLEMSVRTVGQTYALGEDYQLGDKITLIDERLQLSVDAVVTAVQQSVTSQGEQMVITFGYSVPTVYKRLRRR